MSEKVYYAAPGGQQVGPLSYAELDALARDGKLVPEDLVWESGTPDWIPASRVLAFAPAASPPPPASPLPPRPPRAAAATTGDRVRSLLDDLGSFSFSEIVPVSRVFDPETLGTPVSWILLVFGLGPLILGSLVEDPQLRVRLFNFGCGALWTAFFTFAFKTERQSLRLGVAVFFATAIFGVLLVSILQEVPPLSWLYGVLTPDRPFVVRIVAFVCGVGLLEEVGKGLILLLLARALGGLENTSDGVFYGLMSGLGFGVWEAIAYTEFVNTRQATTLTFGTGSITVGLYAYFVASVVRIVSLPLLHAIWTAIVGYFIGLSFAVKKKTNAVLLIGFLIAATLHGLYDVFLTTPGAGVLALAIAALSLLLFLAYHRNADRLLAEVLRADGV